FVDALAGGRVEIHGVSFTSSAVRVQGSSQRLIACSSRRRSSRLMRSRVSPRAAWTARHSARREQSLLRTQRERWPGWQSQKCSEKKSPPSTWSALQTLISEAARE